jgi:hypothetical protein
LELFEIMQEDLARLPQIIGKAITARLDWSRYQMGRCIFCGRPAGFLRRRHAECQERHARALAIIPELFSKALHSSLPATRFGELLRDAAGASFIKPRDLSSICLGGMSRMIDAVLQERLLTPIEEGRISEIRDALGTGIADVTDLNEKLIKIGMLRELNEGQLPDRVTVVGPMPIELRQHERVIWIFNGVIGFRRRGPVATPPQPAGIAFPATEKDLYCGLGAFVNDPIPTDDLTEEATGDLVVTDRNIYFIFGDGQRRIPMAKISALQPHADGIQVTCEQPQSRSRAFRLSDPWLAANLIVRLTVLAQK